MAKRAYSVPSDASLEDCPAAPTSMVWPGPVSHRLDQLVELANRARTDRTELTAALVCQAAPDEKALVQTVLDYRGKTVGDVVLGLSPGASPIELPRQGPGRRGKRTT
jgi:hypothetical protein